MKKPFLLFTIKCSVILYFAACTGINEYTVAESATPHVTKGSWKINLFTESKIDKTTNFDGYTLTFESNGKIIASRNGQVITGNWYEDDIIKKININLDTKDPALTKLNDYWNISDISNAGLELQNADNPSDGRLQLTSL
jgi:hypothetical protein